MKGTVPNLQSLQRNGTPSFYKSSSIKLTLPVKRNLSMKRTLPVHKKLKIQESASMQRSSSLRKSDPIGQSLLKKDIEASKKSGVFSNYGYSFNILTL